MKAEVQYNDLRGTCAADVTDFSQNSLQAHLEKKYSSFDSQRFFCEGCRIYIGGQIVNPSGTIDYICKDKESGNYVFLRDDTEVSLEEIFSLFKRFEVVLATHNEASTIEVNESCILSLKG